MGRDSDDIHRNFNSSSERNSDNVGEKLFSFSIDFDVVFFNMDIYIRSRSKDAPGWKRGLTDKWTDGWKDRQTDK